MSVSGEGSLPERICIGEKDNYTRLPYSAVASGPSKNNSRKAVNNEKEMSYSIENNLVEGQNGSSSGLGIAGQGRDLDEILKQIGDMQFVDEHYEVIGSPAVYSEKAIESFSGRCEVTCDGSLIAEFDQKGLRGQVGFLKITDGEVVVAASVKGTVKGEVFAWKIYALPVAAFEECAPSNYGEELLDLSEFHGLLEGDTVVAVGNLDLSQLVERPLVLKSLTTFRIVCGTLRPTSPITTYMAKFITSVAGSIVFRQVEDNSGSVTGVRSALVAVKKNLKSPSEVTWTLFSRKYETEDVSLNHMKNNCKNLGRFPGSVVHEGTFPSLLGSSMKDGKHYDIEKLPHLHKLATEGVVYVVLYSGEKMVACSRLLRVQPRRATAVFGNTPKDESVHGEVELYQVSPFDPVKLSINLTVPRADAAAFGIDSFASVDSESCSGLSRRFYEPWPVDLDLTPAPQEGTKDLYPAGDLSGKFGTLVDVESAAATLTDPMLMLFGEYSVIGRGVGVYDSGWQVMGCADLVSESPQVTALAVFSGEDPGDISGILHLSQSIDSIFSETQVYLHLYRTEGEDTKGHQFHVHAREVDRSRQCGTAGGHFNPFSIFLQDKQKFNTRLPNEAQEVGDLSNKWGAVTIPGPVTSRTDLSAGRYFWTDESLPLLGEGSVLNKAVVIHASDGGSERVACANIVMEDIGR
ncbi:LOW QUALITY PROTEIN: uncharacterized protein [Palaemon carinicauda]|uniref:LOW QUALITY PROTEIN: uncharacterized protein n=1 Tax=Palaemon carinicauda TaxID=392227 RepID=UPI0035B59D8F